MNVSGYEIHWRQAVKISGLFIEGTGPSVFNIHGEYWKQKKQTKLRDVCLMEFCELMAEG